MTDVRFTPSLSPIQEEPNNISNNSGTSKPGQTVSIQNNNGDSVQISKSNNLSNFNPPRLSMSVSMSSSLSNASGMYGPGDDDNEVFIPNGKGGIVTLDHTTKDGKEEDYSNYSKKELIAASIKNSKDLIAVNAKMLKLESQNIDAELTKVDQKLQKLGKEIENNNPDKDLKVTDQEYVSRSFTEKLTIAAFAVMGGVVGALTGAAIGLAAGGVGAIPGGIAGAVIGATALTGSGALGFGRAASKGLYKNPQQKHLDQALNTLKDAGLKYSNNQIKTLNRPESSHMRELLSIPKKLNLIKQFTPEQRQMVRTAITHAVATAADPSKADEAGLEAKTKLMTALKGGDMGDFREALSNISPELAKHYQTQGKFPGLEPKVESFEDATMFEPKLDNDFKYDGQQFENALTNKDYDDIQVHATAYLLGKGGGGENVAFLDQLLSATKMPLETEEQAVAFKEHLGVLRKTIGKVGDSNLIVNLKNETEKYIRDQLDKAQDIKDLEGLKEFQKSLSENPKNDKGRSLQVGFLAAKNEALYFVSSKMGQVLLERKDQS